MKENYLVIGSGSMARRHIKNLKTLFPNSIVGNLNFSKKNDTLKKINSEVIFNKTQKAIDFEPNFVIEASPAPFHLENASHFLLEDIPVLIEKPLCSNLEDFYKFEKIIHKKKSIIEVGYCFRYLKGALKFKEILQGQTYGKILSVHIDVGQYLPDWRPNMDYKKSVSANKKLGGGVLLELSHELDYINWFFGESRSVFCKISNSGQLDIDVEDVADAILVHDKGLIVSIHMDFLQKSAHRTCRVITEKGTLKWDLLKNTINFQGLSNSQEIVFRDASYTRNDMFLKMLKRFKKLSNRELDPLVSLDEALRVICLVESMNMSSDLNKLVDIKDLLGA